MDIALPIWLIGVWEKGKGEKLLAFYFDKLDTHEQEYKKRMKISLSYHLTPTT